jgi:ribosomal protein S18 acetylase RimI-like enzyme
MNIVDWRTLDPRALALVSARERVRWLRELGWETRESWVHVERARVTWGLPGLAAVDEGGRVRGLTFFHQSGTRFDLGGVFAESDRIREALLDAVEAVCREWGGTELVAFLYSASFAPVDSLVARGFSADAVDYLTRPLEDAGRWQGSRDPQVVLHDWDEHRQDDVATLLASSYDRATAARFIPEPGLAGWRHYIATMVQHAVCGPVLDRCTRLAYVADLLVGVVLVTELGPGTTHVMQVAVHPEWRRRGLAGELLSDAVCAAGREGYQRMTLLAASRNDAAQALYRTHGFSPVATFVSASKSLRARSAARAS